MKIDSRIQFPNDPASQQVKNSRTAPANSKSTSSSSSGISSASGEDTVRLSSAHGEVQTLAASLAQVADVRSDRVQALQAKVRDGQYSPASGEVADAMINEYTGVNAKA